MRDCSASLLWKEKLKLQPQLPVRPEIRLLNVVKGLNRSVHRLLADPENLAKSTTDGNGPRIVAVSFPVGSDHRRGAQIPAVVQVVVDEWLPGEQVHLVVIAVVCDRPEVANQGAEDPWSAHGQDDGARAGAPLAGTQPIIG